MATKVLAGISALVGAVLFLGAPLGALMILQAFFPVLFGAGPDAGWGVLGIGPLVIGLSALLLVVAADRHLGSAAWLVPSLSCFALGAVFSYSAAFRQGPLTITDALAVALYFVPAAVFALAHLVSRTH